MVQESGCEPCHMPGGHREVANDKADIGQISDCPPHMAKEKCNDTTKYASLCGQRIPTPEVDLALMGLSGAECYMPKPDDALPARMAPTMEPIGPWATGRVDWGPLAGLTGTRPVVDRYSITRYSEGEWRQRNADVLRTALSTAQKAYLVDYNSKNCMNQTFATADKLYLDNNKRLAARILEIQRYKSELERAIKESVDELDLLESERHRLKSATSILDIPESIAAECLDRRTGRWDVDLVRDEVEEELIKEVALIKEIRTIFEKTLADVEAQQAENKAAKQRLEYDWSDKKEANDIDSINVALSIHSNIIMWHPGAVRFSDVQSTEEHYEHFTRETLCQGEATRQRSIALRGTLDAILTNAARDLRAQADLVDVKLAERIKCTDELRAKLEGDLKNVLHRLADTENLIERLKDAVRRMDAQMKVAQTRLDNRFLRPRVENCRDPPCFSLVDECKNIMEGVTAIKAQLQIAEDVKGDLLKARSDLEREIMIKRKSLSIDKDRCQVIRTHYPTTTAMAGH